MKKIKIIMLVALIVTAWILFNEVTCQQCTHEHAEAVRINPKVKAKGKPNRSRKKTLKAYESIGEYTLTAYCGCARCCGRAGARTASGTIPKAKHTIAVDTRLIPYGAKILIGDTIYTAEDCGSAVKGKHIDIYFDSHAEALQFGKQKAEVFRKKEQKPKTKLGLIKPIPRATNHKVMMLGRSRKHEVKKAIKENRKRRLYQHISRI